MLKTKIKISQAKKAWTQYITVPAAMVQDSQYPFDDDDELSLEIEPITGIMIISKERQPIQVTDTGILISYDSKDQKLEKEIEQSTQNNR